MTETTPAPVAGLPDLDALTALLADAKTELPWMVRFHDRAESTFDDIMIEGGIDAMVAVIAANPEVLRLIVGAVNALPALLSALTATRAELAEARREVHVLTRSEAAEIAFAEQERDAARAEADRLRDLVRRRERQSVIDGARLGRVLALTTWEDGEEREDVPVADILDALKPDKLTAPAAAPQPDERDWVTVLDDAMAASGVQLVFDPRNWTAPHTVRGPKASDPDREHPAHVGQTCDEYDAVAGTGQQDTATCPRCGELDPMNWHGEGEHCDFGRQGYADWQALGIDVVETYRTGKAAVPAASDNADSGSGEVKP